MDYAVLIVITTDKNQTTDNIIKNIRKTVNDEQDVLEYDNCKFFLHTILTKYFETKIALLPAQNLDSIPETVKNKIEGILIYFNAKDHSLLESLPIYKEFIREHSLEFSTLLCKELMENKSDGITFNCIKSIYNKFDIIELDRNVPDDDLDEPSGYDELLMALQVFKIPNVESSNDANDDSSEENLEQEMEKFENLLTQVMQFRPNTMNLSRDDRLNYAQNFAEIFEKLILQDENDLPTE